MFKRTGALLFLGVLYMLAAQVGSTFSQALTIFSIFIWTIAAGMFVYLILFRGVKLSFFSARQPQDDFQDEDVNLVRDADEAGGSKGEVVNFPNSAS